jgi:hypothetical protein
MAFRGESVNVQASGFKAGSSVEISIHSVIIKLKTTTADGDGSISVDVVIPATMPAGAHTIEAAGVDPSGAALVMQDDLKVLAVPETDLALRMSASTANGGLLILVGLTTLVVTLGARPALRRGSARRETRD